ncbi:MAG: aspartyl/glutamyl-tRNA(Asn/Gln) amidotransferase subunit C [Chthonomonas sp.]|jgi:aspartyl/glutamyl-tRNA(Asn/Gln) amidotransferase C subunit|nr:Asp-tRNA(Asn)/Glu-tRNA(Gln) amidotransferase subunit GatC [Fimbriimonadaceae bacterium]
MAISLDEVRHVARLARLDLDETEVLALQGELNALLGHFADIQDVDTGDLPPVSHAMSLTNVWSDDRVGVVLQRAEALSNAPLSKAGLFVVPTIIED